MTHLAHSLSDSGSAYTSTDLKIGQLYSRKQLKSAYGILDATINTGVFRPSGKKSIWLFVTEVKSADRTPYRDKLEGDTLTWQGQTSGRTDHLIKDHRQNDDELIVFFRKHKNANPSYSFVYEGTFKYVDCCERYPTTFTLSRT
ncbi:protein of unknown function [Roseovarius lutimaris]|uniref:Uncharacterized protein n=1 Tax=Roseovarius lutimaris TaxID=1005928 RepID=A0A1I5G7P1_9RHOB|nr:DUF3427 domain-containing protein [Roseovarius lutimaris]SFO31521.1 protein of unknown function [Roseovarius lutimaris]